MHPVDGALVSAVALLKQAKRVWDFCYGASVRVGSPWQPKLKVTFTNNFNVASALGNFWLCFMCSFKLGHMAPAIGSTWSTVWKLYLHKSSLSHSYNSPHFVMVTHLYYGLILGTQLPDSMLFFGPHPLFWGSWITFLGFKFMDFVLFSFRCPELAIPLFFPLVMYRQNTKLKKIKEVICWGFQSPEVTKKRGKTMAILIQLVFHFVTRNIEGWLKD